MAIESDSPPMDMPDEWYKKDGIRSYMELLLFVIYKLWERTGGGAGIVSDITVNITTTGTVAVDTDVEFCSGSITRTMPGIDEALKRVTIKNTGSSNITIATPDSALVEGAATGTLPPNDSWTLADDGTDWGIV